MRLRSHSLLLLSWIPLAAIAACSLAGSSSSSDTGERDLIGGRPAAAGELATTLLIKGNCTAAKVGPRHILTAAHCVTGFAGAMFGQGATISITNSGGIGAFASEAGDGLQNFTVDHVSIEPGWAAECMDGHCLSVYVSGKTPTIADAALVVVREDLAPFPEAAIDLSPLEPGEDVIVTGYGCEDAVGGLWNYANQRLRVAETTVVPFDTVIHPGSFIFPADKESGLTALMSQLYGITPGPALLGDAGADADPDAATAGGLCPGDSGGPLYRRGAKPVIVGINANYTFTSGSPFAIDGGTMFWGGSPVTNWHTHVDSTRGRRVGAWLASQGASTTCTKGACELPDADVDASDAGAD
jgi:V8-like Glu-specific endopeptidase